MGVCKGCYFPVFTIFIVLVAISKASSSPVIHRDIKDVNTTLAIPGSAGNLELAETSVLNGNNTVDTNIVITSSSDVEEGRGRKKKLKKKLYYHLWHVVYYYAWFVGILLIKFKAVILFLLGNLTFFVISLIKMLIREIPMWNTLKRVTSPPYGPPQYSKYGPPSTSYGPPSPTYGTPAVNYDQNSYSPVGLYKRQGPELVSGNDAGSTSAHELAYGGQRE